MRVLVLLFAIACGGSSAPKPPTSSSGPPAPLVATPAAPDDVQVATVNGKPVYGSCLVAQAARGATKQEALEQCIAFELLAQQAEAFATDPEVVLATRTAVVSQLVAREYEDKYNRPTDFGTYWDRAVQRNRQFIEHGEVRASAYLRIPVSEKAPADQDAAARAFAEELATALAKERGLMPIHLKELGERIIAKRTKLEFAVVPPYLDNGGLHDTYAKPLFAIPEVGRTSPAVRTPWGWDVILLSELIPAAKPTTDEVVAKVLPEVKRGYFVHWANQFAARFSVKLHDENIGKLEDL